jgi:hydrogenase maturation protease
VSKICVIGVGNAFRGDDGVGLVVARRLGELTLPGVTIMGQSGEGAALMEAWGEASQVILVDAVSSGGEPGYIHRFEAAGQELPDFFSGHSTHAFGLAEAIELARQLDRLPAQLVVYGIEGKSFELGQGLSAEVEAAAGIVIEQIAQELAGRS